MKKNTFVFLAALALAGCAPAHRAPPIFTNDPIVGIQAYKCVNCGINPITWLQRIFTEAPIEQLNPYLYGEMCMDASAGGPSRCGSYYQVASHLGTSNCTTEKRQLGTREQARNNLMSAALRLADAATSEHLSAIKATESNVNLLLGAATAGLTGGATVAASAEGAKILSAAATGTNAGRSLFTETLYRNALGETLVSSIETAHDLERVQLVEKMRWCIDEYPVELALADIQKYLEEGSFYHGLALIRQAAEEKNANTNKAKSDKVALLFSERSAGFYSPPIQKRIDDLLNKINDLGDKTALALAASPPVKDEEVGRLVKLRDPADRARTDAKVAKEMLKMRVTMGKRESQDLDKWEEAVQGLD